jgi:AcrR family transcriptional regulator
MADRVRRRTRPTRAETRQRVLAAAAATFGRRGYEHTSLDDVAAEAGLTKGAIYSSFVSKQALFAALMADQVRERLVGVTLAVDGSRTLAELADSAGHAMTDATFNDPDWHVVFLEYWTRVMRQPELREAFAADRDATHAMIAEFLQRQADTAGAALPMPAERLAIVLLALSNGLAIEQLLEPGRADRALLADTLRMLLRG